MKAFSYILLTILICCCEKSGVSIDAAKLNGTWKLRSSTSLSKTRWTFDPNHLYIASDSSETCRPAEGQPWEYRVTGKTFTARYAGISNGLVVIPDIHYQITTFSDSVLVLENSTGGEHFTKCK